MRCEGTTIRKLRSEDIDRFHGYRSSADLATYQGWTPMSREQALDFLTEMRDVQGLVPGSWIQVGIADSETDELLGDLGLFLEADGGTAEVGFTLHRESHGMGHATRALRLAVDLIFASTAATEVRAVTDARNTPSIKVLVRGGFTLAREQRALFRGQQCTELVYGRSRHGASVLASI